MQNVELRQLDLSPKYRAHLLKAQYTTAAEVLLTPPHHLSQRTHLSRADVDHLVAELSDAVLARPDAQCDAVAHLAARSTHTGAKVSFGDPEIDLLFDGGVRVGSLTEIAGQAASGKTHLCLQLALHVQLPVSHGGLLGGALFISSEGTLASYRLLSLAAHMPRLDGSMAPHRTPWDYLDNIHTEKAPDVDTLEAVISYHVPAAIERINALAATHTVDAELASLSGIGRDGTAASQFLAEHRDTLPEPPRPIRLVILDSIAAPVRATHENASSGFVERSKELVSIGDKLKRIAHVYDCAVVVVNQVQDVFERTGPLPPHLVDHRARTSDSSPNQTPTRIRTGFESDPLCSHSETKTPVRTATTATQQVPSTTSSPRFSFPLPPPPSSLSRTTTSSSSSSSHSLFLALPPPPHIQYNVPSLLYTRFQSPHSTGASIVPPTHHHHRNTTTTTTTTTTSRVSAALGTTWTNLINTRVVCLVTRFDNDQDDDSVVAVKREINVVFGPDVRRGKVGYKVTERGVESSGRVEWRDEIGGGEEGDSQSSDGQGGERDEKERMEMD